MSNVTSLKRRQLRAASDDQNQPVMRLRIQETALDLLVKYGVRGASFGDVAELLEITRANIHYHFGNKDALVDEVIANYVGATLVRFQTIWENEALDIQEKLAATCAANRARYNYFNSEGEGNGWSLITRMRGDSDALSEVSLNVLRNFSVELGKSIATGFEQAVKAGALIANTPIQELTVQAVNIINCAGLTTRDALSFDRLEHLYSAFLNTLLSAYGTGQVCSDPKAFAAEKTQP